MEKNCEFENVTPAELLASKFLSVIGRSTGDYEQEKKIRKSDITVETITALIHEHLYDRLNDSNNSNDAREIKHVQERPYKRKWTDKNNAERTKKWPEYQKSQKISDVDSARHQFGRDSTFVQQKQQSAETAKEEAITKKSADQWNE